jgi:ActR/RegA family two-component response regulator
LHANQEEDIGPILAGLVREGGMAKVLLIEDDAETAAEIKAELTDRGFEVDWAATGIEGLDKARA